MTRQEAVRRLGRNRQKLRSHQVEHLSIFGSTARDEAGPHSDVDVLVEFSPGARVGLFAFVRLQAFLGDVLGTRIDLATPQALRPELRASILGEATRVF
jgi:predicted nucleotidyltransferase